MIYGETPSLRAVCFVGKICRISDGSLLPNELVKSVKDHALSPVKAVDIVLDVLLILSNVLEALLQVIDFLVDELISGELSD